MDLHSKILIALAFGVITSNLAEELHSIRSIRNAFAHAKAPLSFDHELLAGEIKSLRMLNAIKRAEKESKRKLTLDNKSWFLLIVRIILIMFDAFEEHPGSGDEALGVKT